MHCISAVNLLRLLRRSERRECGWVVWLAEIIYDFGNWEVFERMKNMGKGRGEKERWFRVDEDISVALMRKEELRVKLKLGEKRTEIKKWKEEVLLNFASLVWGGNGEKIFVW